MPHFDSMHRRACESLKSNPLLITTGGDIAANLWLIIVSLQDHLHDRFRSRLD